MMISRKLALGLASLAMVWASFADATVKVRYYRGQPTFVSAQHDSVVEVAAPEQVRAREIPIGIAAMNGGPRPVSIGYENISVTTKSGAPVKLITYEDLQHQARVRAGWATFFAVLASAGNGYLAARNSYGRVGRYTYYSPVAAQIGLDRATAQNAALMDSIEEGLAARMAELDGQVLRTTTIDPGRVDGGTVYVELPRNTTIQDLIVSISFAGDVHQIALGDANALDQASAADVAMGLPAAMPQAPVPPTGSSAPSGYASASTLAQSTPAPAAAPRPRPTRRCAISSPTDPDALTCGRN